jgi:uncharacterized protein (TIGR03437 family)
MRWCLRSIAGAAFTLASLQAQPLLDFAVGYPIAIDRTSSPAIYAGRFRSLDGGATWAAYYLNPAGLPQPPVKALVVDPGEPSTLYYATEVAQGAVWKSTDRGATWARANTGLPASGEGVMELFAAKTPPYALYVRIGQTVFKSVDRAVTWRQQGTLPDVGGVYRIAPRDPLVQFYVRGGQVWHSRDDGVTWGRAGSIPTGPNGELLQNSIVELGVDSASSSLVYALETGGWFKNSEGYYWGGFWRSTNQGASWSYVYGPSIQWLYVDPAGGPNLYVTDYLGPSLRRSTDRGLTWNLVDIVPGVILGDTRLALSDTRPQVIYAATPRGVHQSLDSGATWRPLHGPVKLTLALPGEKLQLRVQSGSRTTQILKMEVLENREISLPYALSVNQAWLAVGKAAGSTPETVTITVSAQGLSPGSYKGAITMQSAGAAHGPLTLPVELMVTAYEPGSDYTISTVAGIGADSDIGDGGLATRASILFPYGAATDSSGNLLIADTDHHRIRLVTPDGVIRTVAGTGTAGNLGDGGPAAAAQLNHPHRVLPDPAGGYYIADYDNNSVRKVDASGTIRTVATGVRGVDALAFDPQGNLYMASWSDGVVYRLRVGGTPERVVTSGVTRPTGIAVDSGGVLYISDQSTHKVYKWVSGTLTAVCGTGTAGYNGDGQDSKQAMLNLPMDVAVDRTGRLFISDFGNNRIRVVEPSGIIGTLAGTGVQGFSGDGGPAALAQLNHPAQVWPDPSGVLWVADRWGCRIRKLEVRPQPEVFARGLVNAASFTTSVAPGGLISIFGSDLSAGTASATAFPLPTTLGGASVKVNGVEIPLVYASPAQLNGQLPYETPPGRATAVVAVNGLESAAAAFDVERTAPAILQWSAGRAVAQNQDGQLNWTSRPAAPGSIITVYLTGIGAVDNPVGTGLAASADPLSRPLAEVEAYVGGLFARIHFLGLTPGLAGLAQANLQVPDLPPGDYPVLIRIGGVGSNSPIVAVGSR